MVSKLNEDEAQLNSSEEQVRFTKDKMARKSNQLLQKDVASSDYHERVFFGKDMVNASAEV